MGTAVRLLRLVLLGDRGLSHIRDISFHVRGFPVSGRPACCSVQAFDALCERDPSWNHDLISSITHEAAQPDKATLIQESWAKTQKECAIGWCTPVGGGLAELEARYGASKCRAMRRFGVDQHGSTRVCDNGAKSG